MGVVQRDGEPTLPEDATEIEPPDSDAPTIRAEAARADKAMADDAKRLAQLANLTDVLTRRGEELAGEVEYARALAGAMAGENLFAVQGWVPAERTDTLPTDLAEQSITAAVDSRDPADDEAPPTLIQYPHWARPIKGLFDILGTSPGYREFDVSGFFMIALPIFAAMLIGDAGYGLMFLLLPMLIYRKAAAAAGPAKVHLIMVVGAATMIWGLLTGNIFGISPDMLIRSGGIWAFPGDWLDKVRIIRGDLSEQTIIIMKLSFIVGTIHLSLAQLRSSLRLMPNLQFLARVGWAAFLWGMLGVIWYLFFGSQQTPPAPLHPAAPWLLLVGGTLAIFFTHPGRNPVRMIGFGLASFPLAALSTFSDTISYIRLMAVGLASVVIAQTFNSLGAQCADAATWFAGAPIVLIGHALNVALCLIALLAHGVRLNMLEFAGNAGIEWAGYSYEPFANIRVKENG
ncbi:MAG: hypothetical protein SVV80_13890 [Planctomycetota bacterium]|nr:hypothetical protein [Planctomycetota bacterium]